MRPIFQAKKIFEHYKMFHPFTNHKNQINILEQSFQKITPTQTELNHIVFSLLYELLVNTADTKQKTLGVFEDSFNVLRRESLALIKQDMSENCTLLERNEMISYYQKSIKYNISETDQVITTGSTINTLEDEKRKKLVHSYFKQEQTNNLISFLETLDEIALYANQFRKLKKDFADLSSSNQVLAEFLTTDEKYLEEHKALSDKINRYTPYLYKKVTCYRDDDEINQSTEMGYSSYRRTYTISVLDESVYQQISDLKTQLNGLKKPEVPPTLPNWIKLYLQEGLHTNAKPQPEVLRNIVDTYIEDMRPKIINEAEENQTTISNQN